MRSGLELSVTPPRLASHARQLSAPPILSAGCQHPRLASRCATPRPRYRVPSRSPVATASAEHRACCCRCRCSAGGARAPTLLPTPVRAARRAEGAAMFRSSPTPKVPALIFKFVNFAQKLTFKRLVTSRAATPCNSLQLAEAPGPSPSSVSSLLSTSLLARSCPPVCAPGHRGRRYLHYAIFEKPPDVQSRGFG